ncbi:hypothetical protein [Salinimicrobium sp. HB62]|uniref:hypothetical protein n=1 Tax=Salinimicrobium sp. HB62 TaxID=3077781 RepID=UPI002D7A2BC8|nr:hypothetical protein [Salinimicrobium sp. HB62]
MKAIIHTLVMSLATFIAAHSQTQFDTGMQQAFELWQQGETSQAANLFERIGRAEEQEWLPFYYAAQIQIVESFEMTDRAQKEEQLKKAQGLLNDAKAIAGNDDVELKVLQAMLHTSYITLDPSMYGMKLSPVITNLYATAASEAPENPRVALSRTEWNIGSANFFGEDPAKFCPDLEAALLLFQDEEPDEAYAPRWGKDRTLGLIAQICEKKSNE